MGVPRANIVEELQLEILRLQGYKPGNNIAVDLGLGPISDSFPEHSFPLGAVHEFISTRNEDRASTSAFITGLLSQILSTSGTAMWISASRKLFPPALKAFGVQPHRIIFIDLKNDRDVMWAMEEALKCSSLSAVICEMNDLNFTASRRLQLAVEHSKVTGFVIRPELRKLQTTACISRWRISTAPSARVDDLPGVGFPQWKAELLRIRNGRPGSWDIRWANGKFNVVGNHSQGNIDPLQAPYAYDESQILIGKTG